jgi:hypothetical protein
VRTRGIGRPLSEAQFEVFARKVLGPTSPIGCSGTRNPDTEFLSDAELLSDKVHLARERGISPEACDAHRWRVVAVVLDDCKEPDAGEYGAHGCAPEIRVIAQPFTQTGLGLISHDYSMHLIYAVPNRRAFAQDAANLRRSGATFEGYTSILTRHASPERLVRIAWSTSSHSGQHWSFGRLARRSNNEWQLERLPSGGWFDNYSKPEALRGMCGINRESDARTKAIFRCQTDSASFVVGDEIRRLQDAAHSRRNEGRCVSCHMADQMSLLSDPRTPLLDENGLSAFARNNVKLGNQRQLGYRYDGRFWLSKRMTSLLGGTERN